MTSCPTPLLYTKSLPDTSYLYIPDVGDQIVPQDGQLAHYPNQ